MNNLMMSVSPHITSSFTTKKLMRDMLIALIPCAIMSVLFFGWGALIMIVICAGSAYLWEFLYNLVFAKANNQQFIFKEATCNDLSCLVTGVLLALNLPVSIVVNSSGSIIFNNIWMVFIGSAFSIIIVKMIFGGIGKNFVNPALMGRIFMLFAFSSVIITTGTYNIIGIDNVSSATWLDTNTRLASVVKNNWLEMLLGNRGASAVGETCIIAVVIGMIYLTIRRVIDVRLPLIIIGSTALFAFLMDGLPRGAGSMEDTLLITAGHLLSGGLWFGAVFMATDYSTSPNTFLGKAIYGVGIAILTVLIRVFGKYPEGISFAIVIMNIFSVIIDRYIYPKPFGHCKKARAEK